jgi:transcriptional regulator with XRE-family HTH domain
MKFQDLHHDEAVLAEFGRRMAQLRIDRGMTQAELSQKAGVGKRTLERLEAGETTQTRTLFRIFRELDMLAKLEILLPEPTTRPSHAIKEDGQLPKRASKRKPKTGNAEAWKWGDEK